MYEQGRFLAELDTFIRFKTCVDQNPGQFERARALIKEYFDNSGIQILMSNPRVFDSHADEECLDAASLEPTYQLVREMVLLDLNSP